MQSFYPECFEREMSCSPAEWQSLLPRAIGLQRWVASGDAACVWIEDGQLSLRWHSLPPRRIGLIRLERMQLQFEFRGLSEASRHAFMTRFDLYTQRGGG